MAVLRLLSSRTRCNIILDRCRRHWRKIWKSARGLLVKTRRWMNLILNKPSRRPLTKDPCAKIGQALGGLESALDEYLVLSTVRKQNLPTTPDYFTTFPCTVGGSNIQRQFGMNSCNRKSIIPPTSNSEVNDGSHQGQTLLDSTSSGHHCRPMGLQLTRKGSKGNPAELGESTAKVQ